MEDFFSPAPFTMFAAGAAGALVFSFLRPDRSSLSKAATNISVGTLTSYFVTPFFCEWRELTTIHQQHVTAFAFGLLGVIFCKAIIAGAENELAEGIGRAISRYVRRVLLIDRDEPPEST